MLWGRLCGSSGGPCSWPEPRMEGSGFPKVRVEGASGLGARTRAAPPPPYTPGPPRHQLQGLKVLLVDDGASHDHAEACLAQQHYDGAPRTPLRPPCCLLRSKAVARCWHHDATISARCGSNWAACLPPPPPQGHRSAARLRLRCRPTSLPPPHPPCSEDGQQRGGGPGMLCGRRSCI